MTKLITNIANFIKRTGTQSLSETSAEAVGVLLALYWSRASLQARSARVLSLHFLIKSFHSRSFSITCLRSGSSWTLIYSMSSGFFALLLPTWTWRSPSGVSVTSSIGSLATFSLGILPGLDLLLLVLWYGLICSTSTYLCWLVSDSCDS